MLHSHSLNDLFHAFLRPIAEKKTAFSLFAGLGLILFICNGIIAHHLPKSLLLLESNFPIPLDQPYQTGAFIGSFLILAGLCLTCWFIGGILGLFLLLVLTAAGIFDAVCAITVGHYGGYVFIAISSSDTTDRLLFWCYPILGGLFLLSTLLFFLLRKNLSRFRPFCAFGALTGSACLFSLQIYTYEHCTFPKIIKPVEKQVWITPIPVFVFKPWPISLAAPSSEPMRKWQILDSEYLRNKSHIFNGIPTQTAFHLRHAVPGMLGDLAGFKLVRTDPGMQILTEEEKTFPAGLTNTPPRAPAASLIVFIIGESSTPSHYGLYGYPRPTTPLLQAREEKAEICHLAKAHAAADQTRFAVLPYVTLWSPRHQNQAKKQTNLIELAKRNGFTTYWATVQNETGVFAGDIENAMFSADYYKGPLFPFKTYPKPIRSERLGNTDIQALLPDLQAILKDKAERQLIILHPYGSHALYSERIEARDKAAFPEDTYDASIYHTDRFIDAVLSEVQKTGQPAIVFYASDHGEVPAPLGGHALSHIQRKDFPIPVIAAGLNGIKTTSLCQKLNRLRQNNGWYNSAMNRYFLAELLGYQPDPNEVKEDKAKDLILGAENGFAPPLLWDTEIPPKA